VLLLVLTYRAPASLRRCLEAVGHQSRPPDDVLVVDNDPSSASQGGSLPHTAGERVRVLRTGDNLGPAGGHAVGLAEFRDDGRWTHAWVMDDDCVPDPQALQRLVEAARGSAPGHLVLPTWVDGRTGTVTNYPGWCGLLLDREAVRRGGLPRAEMFWWAEDTEYLQHRLPRRGVHVHRAVDAVVVHEPVRRSAGRAPWKTYYEVRNSVYYRLRVQRRWPVGPVKLLRVLAALLVASMREPPRRERLRLYVCGLLDGLRGRLGRRVTPPDDESGGGPW
jgi:GT2 family glycosyltransferase